MYRARQLASIGLAIVVAGCSSSSGDQAPGAPNAGPGGRMTTPPGADGSSPEPIGPPPVVDGGAPTSPGPGGTQPPPAVAPKDGGPAADGAAPPADAAPAAPVGAFPADAVKAIKLSLYAGAGAHLEGPSWWNGELFFAADGAGWGLMRVDSARKLFRYQPALTPVGTYVLADGSMLACDHKYFLVQLFPDGKAGVLPHDGIGEEFCNDVTVDAPGNIYISARHTGFIYRIAPTGEVAQVAAGLSNPNGVEVDPDSKYLYFSAGANISRITIPASGNGFGKPEMVAPSENSDGMVFDVWGNLWTAAYAAGAVVVHSHEGMTLARIPLSQPINLTFGGKDGDTLFAESDNRGIMTSGPIPGMRGFLHPGAPKYTIKQMLDLTPANTPH
jgi:sugar lactone lactonase YvrE